MLVLHPHAWQPRCSIPRCSSSSSRVEWSEKIGALGRDELADACTFFVEAFWAGGTTFGEVGLSQREKKQLASRMSQDFTERYSNSWESSTRLFPSRLLIARDDDAHIAGVVGVEAALLNPFTRQVFTRAESELLLRSELDAMDGPSFSKFSKLSRTEMTRQLYPEYQLIGLLTNLAVAPSSRRRGLARALCEECEAACSSWKLPGLLLQVEEANAPARALYDGLGFEELWQDSDATCLRLAPGAGSVASALLMLESEELLKSEPSTIVTLARAVRSVDG